MDVPIRELERNGVVHPEASDLLIGARPAGTPPDGRSLALLLAGCEVTLEGNEEVVLQGSRESRNEHCEVDTFGRMDRDPRLDHARDAGVRIGERFLATTLRAPGSGPGSERDPVGRGLPSDLAPRDSSLVHSRRTPL